MCSRKIIVLFLLLFQFNFHSCQYYKVNSIGDEKYFMGSTHQMTHLLAKELNLVNSLRLYQNILQNELKNIEEFLNLNYPKDAFNEASVGDLVDYVSNPINAFGIIKRTQYGNWEELINQHNVFRDQVQNFNNLSDFKDVAPTLNVDYYSATLSIALLQVSNFTDLGSLNETFFQSLVTAWKCSTFYTAT